MNGSVFITGDELSVVNSDDKDDARMDWQYPARSGHSRVKIPNHNLTMMSSNC